VSTKNEWLIWVADNLSRGASEAEILVALRSNEVSAPERIVETVKANPLYGLILQQRGQLNRWSELMRDLERLEAASGPPYNLASRSAAVDFDFVGQFVSKNRPLVIEEWVNRWPCYPDWSFDFFGQILGDTVIKYQDRSNLSNHLETFSDNTQESTFRDFLDAISLGEKDIYLIAHDKALDRIAFRNLLAQVPSSPSFFNENLRDGRIFLWMGARGATTHMHRDLNNGIVTQIRGRRRFSLIPSRQMDLVYNTSGFVSDVDFSNPDLDRFPKLKQATIITGILEPGQALFLPLGWWHYFEALEPTISLTFANVRRES
jgi:hypothetical protein